MPLPNSIPPFLALGALATGATEPLVVFSSTSSIYGLNTNFPLKETEKENCLNAYSSTKYAAELLLANKEFIKAQVIAYINRTTQYKTVKAGYFNVGSVYTIQSVGTTNFTLIGAERNEVGVFFTATAVGTGTGLVTTAGDGLALQESTTEAANFLCGGTIDTR